MNTACCFDYIHHAVMISGQQKILILSTVSITVTLIQHASSSVIEKKIFIIKYFVSTTNLSITNTFHTCPTHTFNKCFSFKDIPE
jgi:hypothetical protein